MANRDVLITALILCFLCACRAARCYQSHGRIRSWSIQLKLCLRTIATATHFAVVHQLQDQQCPSYPCREEDTAGGEVLQTNCREWLSLRLDLMFEALVGWKVREAVYCVPVP